MKNLRLLLPFLCCFLLSQLLYAQFQVVIPESAGVSSERLERIDNLIQQDIDDNKIAGVISLVLRDGKAVHQKAYGMMDKEARKPMRTDAIFRIASMSKALTSVAIMMLYEEGHFLLNDPVDHFIPEFKDPVVAVAPPKDAPKGTKYVTEPANGPIRIRHLLSHTAGLTYGYGIASDTYQEAGMQGWYLADREVPIGEVIKKLAKLPLHAHPGEKYQYGYSTDVLGYLVEVVSGMPFDQFLQERLFKPLGMKDTQFFLPPEKADRLAPVYGYNEEGKLVLMESTAETDYIHGPRKCFGGGAGILSTMNDYGRFLQMLLNEGELDGARILSRKSVELMHANHSGDLFSGPGEHMGLGFASIKDLGAYGEVGTVGAYRWGSAYYPLYWIDPEERLVGMFLTQLRPAGSLPLKWRYRAMVYHALLD